MRQVRKAECLFGISTIVAGTLDMTQCMMGLAGNRESAHHTQDFICMGCVADHDADTHLTFQIPESQ